MNRTFFRLLCLFSMSACGGGEKEVTEQQQIREKSDSITDLVYKKLADSLDLVRISEFKKHLDQQFAGKRGPNDLSIFINYLGNRSAVGFNMVGEERRNFKGNYEVKRDTFFFHLTETGNKKSDGYYDLFIPVNDSVLSGKWTSYLNAGKTEPVRTEMWKYSPESWKKDTNSWLLEGTFVPKQESNNYILTFLRKGNLKFEYYEDFADDKGQIKTIRGTWKRNKLDLYIHLPENGYFDKEDMVFRIDPELNEAGEMIAPHNISLQYGKMRFHPLMSLY